MAKPDRNGIFRSREIQEVNKLPWRYEIQLGK